MIGIKDLLDLTKHAIQRSVLSPQKGGAGESIAVLSCNRTTYRDGDVVQSRANPSMREPSAEVGIGRNGRR